MNKAVPSKFRVGVDIGGTFTDIIFIGEDGSVISKKLLSTPDDYSRAILDGINSVLRDNGLSSSSIEEVVHGSTIVTNACIELKGAKIGLITTKGFRDVLEIGRGRMPVMYDLSWQKPVPLAPRRLRFEVDERVNSEGEIIQPLDIDEARAVIDKLISKGVEAVAVCLFNSPKNPTHEQKIGQLLKEMAPELYVSLSTEVMAILKEYERSSEAAVNAYVMPLVATYLRSLRQRLTETGVRAPLYIMESNGGMITPEVAAERPIDIIECGPAAGVVGCAYLAQQQNIGNIITFDMGGTTVKASIVENGQFTRSPEYEVGGGIHRASRLLKGKGYVLRVPSIDIAEIGAGGGSVLRVDVGGHLHIGPESAGAVPGPACYDLGGEEATLTDANVVLGYLNPDYLVGGEVKLNKDKAFQAIEEKVARPLGIDIVEAAYGAYSIANANMMRAIRAVSSERGRDPRKFTLYAFGGAGPGHAVGVAQGLGIKRVMMPPTPGVSSAFGLLCADIERHYAKAFSYLWDKPQWEESALEDLNRTFDRMTDEAISSVEVWAGKTKVKPLIERYIDIRYEGQAWELSIPVPEGELGQAHIAKLADDFKREYEKTYGYRLNTPMRVANLRLVATIPSKRPSSTMGPAVAHARATTQGIESTRRAYWGKKHGFIDTPVLGLEQIGQEPISGPLLVDCYDTTIVIPPGCTAAMGEWGNVIINIESEVATTKEITAIEEKKIDMIILELINNFLYSLVDEMTQTVVRTSLSPITRDSFDFQCGFCRADGEMLLEGEGTLIHSLIYPTLISNWLKEHRDTTYPGDIIITNDPYSDAAHLPDVYMYQPIFIGNELVAWAVGGGHQRDVGGATPGSCACDSTEIYQEGLRIPPMKLYEKGVRNDTLFTLIKAASRAPDIVEADIETYRAACRTGEERFMELVREYGWETLRVYFDELLDYAERLTRAEIKALPDGDYEFTDYIDDPGAGYLDDKGNIIADPVRIQLKITVKDDSITYDFTGTAPQVKGAMNNPYGTSKATVMSCLRFMMNPDIPRNSGAFRPVTLIIPKGTLLNPVLPAAVASRAATFGRETDVMMGAEAQIVPNKLMASASNIDALLNIGGYDEDGRHFILMEAMWGGWGGRPFADGVDYNTPPELNGANQPCERNEELYPVMYTQYGYLPDREGAGKYRGSVAVVREYKLLADEAVMQLRVDRQRFAPYGLYGGKPGATLEVIFNPGRDNLHIGKTTMNIKRDDVIRIIFAGAGGWGNPLERDVNMVLDDALDEKVSLRRAKEIYGVVIDEKTTEVDIDETERLREAMKKKGVYS